MLAKIAVTRKGKRIPQRKPIIQINHAKINRTVKKQQENNEDIQKINQKSDNLIARYTFRKKNSHKRIKNNH